MSCTWSSCPRPTSAMSLKKPLLVSMVMVMGWDVDAVLVLVAQPLLLALLGAQLLRPLGQALRRDGRVVSFELLALQLEQRPRRDAVGR